nr:hypothetical protein [Treponema sp.]
ASIIQLMNAVEKYAPSMFISIPVSAESIDKSLCIAASNISCSIEIPLKGSFHENSENKNAPIYLFDKKLYSKKANLLNDFSLVFGFDMDYALVAGDNIKAFRNRLDFALSLYPNHIDFAQVIGNENAKTKSTGTFSSQDIKIARDLAYACQTFYSAGRAVPWFLAVLKPLKMYPSRFLSDFAEWQLLDNCGYESKFDIENTRHVDIEKMQLVFLQQKYEEKHHEHLFAVVKDIVRLNGAFSRVVAGDCEECIVDLSYNPDDLLGPESMEISHFADTACMESCKVKIFAAEEGPDYKII